MILKVVRLMMGTSKRARSGLKGWYSTKGHVSAVFFSQIPYFSKIT
jgi:hypothetical protein